MQLRPRLRRFAGNTDRHFGNFGFLVDTGTNQISAPAPLFDHGNSLFNYATSRDLESADTLKQYADTMFPCVYDDFIGEAKKVLTAEHRDGLRKMLTFHFRKHPRYNLPNARLKKIEEVLHDRAKRLLDEQN